MQILRWHIPLNPKGETDIYWRSHNQSDVDVKLRHNRTQIDSVGIVFTLAREKGVWDVWDVRESSETGPIAYRELINRYHFPRRTIFDFIQMVNTTSRPTIRSHPQPVSSIVRNIADIEPNVYIVAQAFHTPTHKKKWIMFSIKWFTVVPHTWTY